MEDVPVKDDADPAAEETLDSSDSQQVNRNSTLVHLLGALARSSNAASLASSSNSDSGSFLSGSHINRGSNGLGASISLFELILKYRRDNRDDASNGNVNTNQNPTVIQNIEHKVELLQREDETPPNDYDNDFDEDLDDEDDDDLIDEIDDAGGVDQGEDMETVDNVSDSAEDPSISSTVTKKWRREPYPSRKVASESSVDSTTSSDLIKQNSCASSPYVTGKKKPEHGAIPCLQCSYTTTRSEDYIKHVLVHVEEESGKPLTAKQQNTYSLCCPFCDYQSTRRQHYKQHLAKHTGQDKLKCPHCDYSTVWKRRYKEHVARHTDQEKWSCSLCQYKTSSSTNYKYHLDKHIGLGNKMSCDYCDYTTSRKQHYKQHLATHTGQGRLQCDQCDYTTIWKTRFKEHMLKHTNSHREKLAGSGIPTAAALSCPVCDFKTSSKHLLKLHLGKHAESKTNGEFSCSVCSFTTTTGKEFRLHLSQHTGLQKYQCDQCSYSTYWSNSFKHHSAKHTGQGVLACPHCDFKSTYKSYMKQHIASHAGNNKLRCPWSSCSYSTSLSDALRQHLATQHSSKQPLQCALCDYTTTSRPCYRQHVSREHSAVADSGCTAAAAAAATKASSLPPPSTTTTSFSCTFCHYQTTRRDKLKIHLSKHTGEGLHACPKCQYTTPRKDNLEVHLAKHEDGSELQCGQCAFLTVYKRDFVKHLASHGSSKDDGHRGREEEGESHDVDHSHKKHLIADTGGAVDEAMNNAGGEPVQVLGRAVDSALPSSSSPSLNLESTEVSATKYCSSVVGSGCEGGAHVPHFSELVENVLNMIKTSEGK